VNLRQIEIFKCVMEAGTVTAAAERLHVSQPAVSKQLAELERRLGFAVFDRVSGRLVPTSEGRALYDEVERVQASLEQLTRFAVDLRATRRGRLSIGALPILSTRWLPGVVGRFLAHRPQVMLALQTLGSMKVIEGVESRRFDVGVAMPSAQLPGVEQELLMRIELVCVLPRKHPLAARRVIAPADFDGENFVWLTTFDRSRLTIDRTMETAGVRIGRRVDTFMAATACALVAERVGLSLLDAVTAAEQLSERVAVRRFRPRTEFDIMLVRPQHSPRSNLVEEFVAELRRNVAATNPGRPRPDLFRTR